MLTYADAGERVEEERSNSYMLARQEIAYASIR
jgi:hypothetical protein